MAAAAQRFAELGAHVEAVDPPAGGPDRDVPDAVVGRRPCRHRASVAGAEGAPRSRPPCHGGRGGTHHPRPVPDGDARPCRLWQPDAAVHGRLRFPAHALRRGARLRSRAPVAIPDDGNAWLGWTPFSYPFNLTQQPAASINCGFTAAGLPVGLQIAGRMYDDAGVLAAAHAVECRSAPTRFAGASSAALMKRHLQNAAPRSA